MTFSLNTDLVKREKKPPACTFSSATQQIKNFSLSKIFKLKFLLSWALKPVCTSTVPHFLRIMIHTLKGGKSCFETLCTQLQIAVQIQCFKFRTGAGLKNKTKNQVIIKTSSPNPVYSNTTPHFRCLQGLAPLEHSVPVPCHPGSSHCYNDTCFAPPLYHHHQLRVCYQ